MLKKLLSLVVLLAVLVLLSADRLLQRQLQSHATQTLNTPVSIGDVSADLLQADLRVDFVKVDNLPGFKKPHLATLDHMTLEVGQVDSKRLLIDQLIFDGTVFYLEQKQDRVNLIQWFQQLEGAQSTAPSQSTVPSQRADHSRAPHQPSSAWRVAIKQLAFVNTQISVDSEFLVDTLVVPDTMIQDFGGAQGVEAQQLGAELSRVILSRAQKVLEERGLRFAEDQIKASLRKQLEKELDGLEGQLGDKAKDLFKKLGL